MFRNREHVASIVNDDREHGEAVESLCFSGDGARAVSTSKHGTVKIWDTATHQCVVTAVSVLGQNNSDVAQQLRRQFVTSASLSYDGSCVVSCSPVNEPIKVWNANTGRGTCLWDRMRPQSFTAFQPDGMLLTISDREYVRVYNPQTGRPIAHWGASPGVMNMSCAVFSEQGIVCTVDKQRKVRLNERELTDVPSAVCAAISPSGQVLALGTDNGLIVGKECLSTAIPTCIALSDRHLVAGFGTQARVYNLHNKQCIQVIPGDVTAVAISRNHVAVGFANGTITIPRIAHATNTGGPKQEEKQQLPMFVNYSAQLATVNPEGVVSRGLVAIVDGGSNIRLVSGAGITNFTSVAVYPPLHDVLISEDGTRTLAVGDNYVGWWITSIGYGMKFSSTESKSFTIGPHIAMSPDGTIAMFQTSVGYVIWKFGTPDPIAIIKETGFCGGMFFERDSFKVMINGDWKCWRANDGMACAVTTNSAHRQPKMTRVHTAASTDVVHMVPLAAHRLVTLDSTNVFRWWSHNICVHAARLQTSSAIPLRYFSVSDDGATMAIVSTAGVIIWCKGACHKVRVEGRHATDAAVSGNGKFMTLVCHGGAVLWWDVCNNCLIREFDTTDKMIKSVVCVQVSRDNKLAQVWSNDGFRCVWKTKTGQLANEPWRNLIGKQVICSRDLSCAATLSGLAILVSNAEGTKHRKLPVYVHKVTRMAMSENGSMLVCTDGSCIFGWDLADNDRKFGPIKCPEVVCEVAIQNRRILLGLSNGQIQTIDRDHHAITGPPKRQLEDDDNKGMVVSRKQFRPEMVVKYKSETKSFGTNKISSIAASPDMTKLFVCAGGEMFVLNDKFEQVHAAKPSKAIDLISGFNSSLVGITHDQSNVFHWDLNSGEEPTVIKQASGSLARCNDLLVAFSYFSEPNSFVKVVNPDDDGALVALVKVAGKNILDFRLGGVVGDQPTCRLLVVSTDGCRAYEIGGSDAVPELSSTFLLDDEKLLTVSIASDVNTVAVVSNSSIKVINFDEQKVLWTNPIDKNAEVIQVIVTPGGRHAVLVYATKLVLFTNGERVGIPLDMTVESVCQFGESVIVYRRKGTSFSVEFENKLTGAESSSEFEYAADLPDGRPDEYVKAANEWHSDQNFPRQMEDEEMYAAYDAYLERKEKVSDSSINSYKMRMTEFDESAKKAQPEKKSSVRSKTPPPPPEEDDESEDEESEDEEDKKEKAKAARKAEEKKKAVEIAEAAERKKKAREEIKRATSSESFTFKPPSSANSEKKKPQKKKRSDDSDDDEEDVKQVTSSESLKFKTPSSANSEKKKPQKKKRSGDSDDSDDDEEEDSQSRRLRVEGDLQPASEEEEKEPASEEEEEEKKERDPNQATTMPTDLEDAEIEYDSLNHDLKEDPSSVSVSGDMTKLFVSLQNGAVCILDSQLQLVKCQQIARHQIELVSPSFDGKYAVCLNSNGFCWWKVDDEEATAYIQKVSAACTSGEQYVAFAYEDVNNRGFQIAEPRTGKVIKLYKCEHVLNMKFHANGTLWVVTAKQVLYCRPEQELETKVVFDEVLEIDTASFSPDCKTVALAYSEDQGRNRRKTMTIHVHHLDRHASPMVVDVAPLNVIVDQIVMSSDGSTLLLLTNDAKMAIVSNGVVDTDMVHETGNSSVYATFGFFPGEAEVLYCDYTQLKRLDKGFTGWSLDIGESFEEEEEGDVKMGPAQPALQLPRPVEAGIVPMDIDSTPPPLVKKPRKTKPETILKQQLIAEYLKRGTDGEGVPARLKKAKEPIYNNSGQLLRTVKKGQKIFDENKNEIVGKSQKGQKIYDEYGDEIVMRKKNEPIYSKGNKDMDIPRFRLFESVRPVKDNEPAIIVKDNEPVNGDDSETVDDEADEEEKKEEIQPIVKRKSSKKKKKAEDEPKKIAQLMEDVTNSFKFNNGVGAKPTCLVTCTPGSRVFVCVDGVVVTLDNANLRMQQASRLANNELGMDIVSPSVDGVYMAGVTIRKQVCWWHIENGKGIMVDVPKDSAITHVRANKDYLAVATLAPRKIIVWSPSSGKILKTLDPTENIRDMKLDGHELIAVTTTACSICKLRDDDSKLEQKTRFSFRTSRAHIGSDNSTLTYSSDNEIAVMEDLYDPAPLVWSHDFKADIVIDFISSSRLLAVFLKKDKEEVMQIYRGRDTGKIAEIILPDKNLYGIVSSSSVAYVRAKDGKVKLSKLIAEEVKKSRSSAGDDDEEREPVLVKFNQRRRTLLEEEDAPMTSSAPVAPPATVVPDVPMPSPVIAEVKQQPPPTETKLVQVMERVKDVAYDPTTKTFSVNGQKGRNITCLIASHYRRELFVCVGGTVVALGCELQLINAFRPVSADRGIATVSVSPNDKFLVGLSDDNKGYCYWWDLKTGMGNVYSMQVKRGIQFACASSDGFLICTDYARIYVWDPRTGQLVRTFESRGKIVAMTMDGPRLVVATENDIAVVNRPHDPTSVLKVTILFGFVATNVWFGSGNGETVAVVSRAAPPIVMIINDYSDPSTPKWTHPIHSDAVVATSRGAHMVLLRTGSNLRLVTDKDVTKIVTVEGTNAVKNSRVCEFFPNVESVAFASGPILRIVDATTGQEE